MSHSLKEIVVVALSNWSGRSLVIAVELTLQAVHFVFQPIPSVACIRLLPPCLGQVAFDSLYRRLDTSSSSLYKDVARRWNHANPVRDLKNPSVVIFKLEVERTGDRAGANQHLIRNGLRLILTTVKWGRFLQRGRKRDATTGKRLEKKRQKPIKTLASKTCLHDSRPTLVKFGGDAQIEIV